MLMKNLKELSANLSVLYVEDDKEIAYMFCRYLKKFFKNVTYKENGEEGLDTFKENNFDLIITDIEMPKMNGLEMSAKIKQINEEQNILIVSAYSDLQKFLESIKIGIDGYILKPVDFDELNKVLYKVLNKIKKFKESKIYEENLEQLVDMKSEELILLQNEKIEDYKQILYALVDLIESRDIYTGKHSLRVAQYAKLIAVEMGFSKEDCEEIYKAGILHDIGKIAIPDTLLLKPSKLDSNEYTLIKEHVSIGVHMLKKIPMFRKMAKYIESHHERLDGSGYPNGLKGDEIPVLGNILAVADSFDAMTTNRIYKHRKEVDEALKEIESLKGKFFKEEIVEAAKESLKDINIDLSTSQLPQSGLEKERFSYFYKDSLTNLYNDKYLDIILSKSIYKDNISYLNLILIHDFSQYNKNMGWTKGDEFLKYFAKKLVENFPDNIIFRIHGDDFVILSSKDRVITQNDLAFVDETLKEANLTISVDNYDIVDLNIDSLFKLDTFI